MAVSQSAPHTPVTSYGDGAMKTVPRLLSEPLVTAKNHPSPGVKSLEGKNSKCERISPFLNKKSESVDNSCDEPRVAKVSRAGSVCVPVHSPKGHSKKESKFSLKSPLVKKETKIHLENNFNNSFPVQDKVNKGSSNVVVDGTDV